MRQIYISAIMLCLCLNFCPPVHANALILHAGHATAPITITGQVTGPDGQPLPGVSVSETGTKNATSTSAQGYYIIKVDNPNAILRFSFVGMKPQDIAVAGRQTIDIQFESSSVELQEVTVSIGYGSIRKEEVTSSVARVGSDDFVKGLVTSPLDLLRGKIAGLAISHTSGNPANQNVDIMLRGVSTLAASASPLIVIDGITGGSLNAVNPDNIESITVLKDGSAAAIYGTQGTNGVIIITTKTPTAGKATVTYNGYASIDKIRNPLKILTAADVRRYKQDPAFSTINDYGSSTDWLKEITGTPVSQVHDLSVSGGNRNTSYVGDVSLRQQNGVINETSKRSLITTFRVNHAMFDDKLKLNFNISNNVVTDHQVPVETYANALLRSPTLSVYNDDGSYRELNNTGINPVGLVNEAKGSNEYNQLMMNGKIAIRPVKSLELSAMGAYQNDYNIYNYSTTFRSYAATLGGRNGEAYLNGGRGENKNLELQANYSKTFSKHIINAMLGYSYQDYTKEAWGMSANNFPLDIFGAWNIGSANSIKQGLAQLSSNKFSWKLIAFFGRINYNFDDKYLVMASLRREGSSKFGVNNKWGYFPAVSAGWRISNESFMKDVSFINDLKLRAGFGITGTAPTDAYLSLTTYRFDPSIAMYDNGQWVSALVPSSNPNPNLKWERKREINVGLDFTLFNKVFNGSIDVYHRRTNDLLYTYSVPVPPNIYNSIFANVGSISNKGIEFAGSVQLINKDKFSWSVLGNVSYNQNKVISLSGDVYKRDYLNVGETGEPIQTYTHRIESGQALGNFYAWEVSGLKPVGNQWQVVGAGDDSPGEQQKKIVGNGMPKVFSGLTTNLRYGNLDMTVALRGTFGFDILNQYRMQRETLSWIQTYNLPQSAFDKPFGGNDYNTAPPIYSNYYIEKGNFVKLDNVAIGYSFTIKNQPYLKRARIYLSGQNLATITGYKGMDPEVAVSGVTPGVDVLKNYPNVTTYLVGLNLNF
ncbi:SusC/RagA family TonB-linked outer membrane protein [Mucilaginibacter limnophilus]|uniref:SusC/RagA family TonB-linked outer membrane protein n=1 Tax=Mucilaginibacter limnophilus TaxID=1932778 RepID=A0A3S2UP77_9SPHI|nr:SusC/RagA family TonB-linked outer membrane protein [Mucilaginibacter limnophilus]RVU00999.1 SusC/RagA family TonB-linked outer membrane protein [Mucilaginibacter limnophilus]